MASASASATEKEPTARLPKTLLGTVISALQVATAKGAWNVEDLELMGRTQMTLRRLFDALPKSAAADAAAGSAQLGSKRAAASVQAIDEEHDQ